MSQRQTHRHRQRQRQRQKNRKKQIYFIFLFFIFSQWFGFAPAIVAAPARSPALFNWSVGDKQKKKETSRWSIEDWLSQKKKVNWSNYWLAMNTSSVPYELSLGGSDWRYEIDPPQTGNTQQREEEKHGDLTLYYRILGMSGEYERNTEEIRRTLALIHLRLLGTSMQSSLWEVHYGWRKNEFLNSLSTYEHYLSGSSMTLYFFDYLGAWGQYRHYHSQLDSLSTEHSGHRWQYGIFLEWGVVRIFANQVEELSRKKDAQDIVSETKRKGTEIGLRLYF